MLSPASCFSFIQINNRFLFLLLPVIHCFFHNLSNISTLDGLFMFWNCADPIWPATKAFSPLLPERCFLSWWGVSIKGLSGQKPKFGSQQLGGELNCWRWETFENQGLTIVRVREEERTILTGRRWHLAGVLNVQKIWMSKGQGKIYFQLESVSDHL